MRTSLIPPYKHRKNRLDSLTSCSAQFCVGSCTTPSPVPFWASSRSNTTAICGVWFALPHPLPRGRTMCLFLCEMNVLPGKCTMSHRDQCTAERSAPAQRHRAHPARLLPSWRHRGLSAWKDIGCQQWQDHRAVQNRDIWRNEKMRHYWER